MSKTMDELRKMVYGSANPSREQVQAVEREALKPVVPLADTVSKQQIQADDGQRKTSVQKRAGRIPATKKDALVNAITSSIAKNVTEPGNLRTAQASGRISGGFSGRQDDLPHYISRAAGTATAQSDAALRTDPVRTQAPNTAANPAGRSAQKDFSLLELLGGTVVKGADEAVSRATSTAAWLERNTIGRLFPGAADDTPIQALNEHFQNVKQENQEAFAPNVEAGGRLAQVVDKYGTSVVSAIPSAALAVMTAGTAPAGLEAAASAASRSPGILSALQASAQNMTKNPQFWNSFFQVAGSSYDEALSLGMSEDEADLYALANGLLSSGVEIGGGLETLPSNLKDSSGALQAWIRGMMEEGREEVVQGAISRGLQNMIGSVGNPLVSATDERAVFNPRTAAEEFTGGAVVGGFLGGGQVLAGRLLNGPTAAQEGAGAAAGQKMGTDAAQVWGGSEGVQDAWRDTIVNEVRRNSGIGENESPASTSDGTSALSGDLETVVDAEDMAAIPGTVGTVTDGRASQVAPISTVQETGINVNHQEGQNRIRNTGETVRVVETLRDHIPKLSEAEPVSEVSSNSIPFVSGKTMAEKAKTLFEAIKGIVSRPGFGDIEINTRSVKDDLHHGIGTAKAAVIPAIPDIIRTGTQIDFQENWKGRPYDGYIFAAPVTMDGKTVYVAAVVKRTSKNRFYLHEVVDSDGNIIKIDAGDSANQTSLATNGSAGTQSQASVEGTRPLNPDSIIAPGAENVNPPDGLGAADAGTLGDFTTMQNESDVFHPINQQTQEREIEMGRAPEEVPVINPRTGRNITKTVSTILNSPLTSNEMARTIEASVSEGQFDYAPVTDRAANLRAQQDISKQGLDDVAQYFLAKVDFGQKITKQDMASGIAAYNQAVADGNHMLALNLATAISESAHNSAQVVQAMNLMNRLTPEGKLLALRKFLTRMNRRRQGTQQPRNVNTHSQEDVDAARLDYVENSTGFSINDELAANYLMAETDAERAAAWDVLLTNVAQQVPSTFLERANFWRYTSMLLNPTTHARNLAGNAIQWGARKIKNGVGAAIERAVIRDQSQRTKSFTTSKDLRSFAKEQYKIDQEAAMGSGKYSDTSAAGINREIQERRKVFSAGTNSILAKGVQAVGDFNTWLMDAGDVLFNRPAYIDSFAQALKAKGITAEQARNGGPEVEAARAYAIQEAQKATYRNTTALSEAVSRMGRYEGDNPVLKAASFLADAELPFRRTPANVLTTGLDYSPVGLARGIKNALWDVRKGNMDAAAAIDRISEGLTGSAIMALGAYLAAEGFLHVRAGGDDDEKEFNQDRGMQDYSLQIGDMSYSLDWALPAAMPLFAGAAVMESVQEADGTFSALADAMTGISEVVLESSMMSSLDDLIANWSYADNKATYLIDDVVTSYLGQYVPTIGGKIASTMDETVRRSYTEPGTGQVSSDAQYFLQSIMKKVPGVRNQLQPSVDLWGNEKSNGSFEERLFQSFVSPGILRTTDTGPIDREIRHLAEATGDSSVYPKEAEKSFAVNGERKDLTAEEYTQYAKVLGQTRYKTIQSLMEDPAYNRLSYDDKAKAISYAYQYATAIGKQAVSAYKPADSSFAKGAINSSLPIESYILYQIDSDRNHNGSTDSVESATTLQELTGITNRQRGAAWAQKNSQTSEAKNPFTGALPSAGVSVNTSIAILEKYRALYNDDSMKTREKAQAFKDYVYGLGLSGGQLAAVKETYTWWGSYPVEW